VVGVHGVTEHESAVVFVAHHAVADGFGTVKHAVALLLSPEARSMDVELPSGPSALKRFAATATGLGQLATDGTPRWRAEGCDGPGRRFGTVWLPLSEARELSRRLGVRMTDLVLCLMAGGISRVVDRAALPQDSQLRVSVTLMVPRPGSGVEGNATAAAMLDVPIGERVETDRLAEIVARSGRLRSGTRALASRWVMDTLAEVLPPVAHAWFARTVYGRRFFHAVASNMPGPTEDLTLAGYPVLHVYPILPLAPGAPVAVGALSVSGKLGVGITVHPSFVADVDALRHAVTAVYDELGEAASRRSASDLAPAPR
jgi:uncharacterized protein DUF1298